jgi:high-affinity K+ transport system ATPase subunit B
MPFYVLTRPRQFYYNHSILILLATLCLQFAEAIAEARGKAQAIV